MMDVGSGSCEVGVDQMVGILLHFLLKIEKINIRRRTFFCGMKFCLKICLVDQVNGTLRSEKENHDLRCELFRKDHGLSSPSPRNGGRQGNFAIQSSSPALMYSLVSYHATTYTSIDLRSSLGTRNAPFYFSKKNSEFAHSNLLTPPLPQLNSISSKHIIIIHNTDFSQPLSNHTHQSQHSTTTHNLKNVKPSTKICF